MIVRTLALLGFIVAAGYLFYRTYRPFGGRLSKARKEEFGRSSHYVQEKFVNQIPTDMRLNMQATFSLLGEHLRGNPDRRPRTLLQPEKPDPEALATARDTKVVWFGHSAFLVHVGGQTLLLDPMLGSAPSPFPTFGPHRFSDTLPLSVEQLPYIDAVLISHDHYDHLDYPSISKLKGKVGKFFVPLGVGVHLEKWGVPPAQITELDWWEEVSAGNLQLTCTPSRHFSGRTLTDRFATLWCSWVIRSTSTTLFFSGDTGYGPHFKQIGDAYGPFDLALLECGQYDTRWANIHMQPEQTVQACIDLRSKRMLPIHWGAFVLALHSWTEPVERALAEAKKRNVAITTPRVGEVVTLNGTQQLPHDTWWRNL